MTAYLSNKMLLAKFMNQKPSKYRVDSVCMKLAHDSSTLVTDRQTTSTLLRMCSELKILVHVTN